MTKPLRFSARACVFWLTLPRTAAEISNLMMEKIKDLFLPLIGLVLTSTFLPANDRIPFYEDYLEKGNLQDYLKTAHQFLDENPEAPEAPRIALDLMMMGKAAEDFPSVVRGTDLLLFDYLGSLTSLHFISSFDKGSDRLTQLIMVKTEEADLNSDQFAQSYGDALTLLTRIHGPSLLANPSLRLRSFLILEKSEHKELRKSIEESFDSLIEKNDSVASLFSICKSESAPLEKIKSLYLSSHPQTDFCIKYYLSQLGEDEKNSTEFLELMIQLNLFGTEPRPQAVLSYLAKLPQEISTSLKYQIYTAFAHLLDGNSEDSLDLLKGLSDSSNEDDSALIKIARSMRDGFEFGENRKDLLIENLDKAFDRLEADHEFDVTFIQGKWKGKKEEDDLVFSIGVNKENNLFEIHFHKNQKPFFAYRIDHNGCSLFSPTGKSYRFKQGGAYPLPKIDITREIDSGTFNYSFNLNFSRSFSDFISQISENMDNSYLGTSKGREVLLSHFINRKGFWFSPPASSKMGTVFSLCKLSSDNELLTHQLELAISGSLVSLNLGNLTINQFSQGKAELLEKIPSWPEGTAVDQSEFDLPLLLESIGKLMGK